MMQRGNALDLQSDDRIQIMLNVSSAKAFIRFVSL